MASNLASAPPCLVSAEDNPGSEDDSAFPIAGFDTGPVTRRKSTPPLQSTPNLPRSHTFSNSSYMASQSGIPSSSKPTYEPSGARGTLASFRSIGLRINARRQATRNAPVHGFASAYIDQDESGDFDPSLQAPASPENPYRKRKRNFPAGSNYSSGGKRKRSKVEEDDDERDGPSSPDSDYRRGIRPVTKKRRGSSKALPIPPPPAPPTPPPKKAYVACNQCRGRSIRCSLKRDQDGPCSNCKKANQSCNFIYERVLNTPHLSGVKMPMKPGKTGSRSTRAVGEGEWTSYSPDQNSEQLSLEMSRRRSKSEAQGSQLQKKRKSKETDSKSRPSQAKILITTAFSHPVKFNYIPDHMGQHPACSFCSTPVFGLWGLGVREGVEIIPWRELAKGTIPIGLEAGDLGNEEIGGGWAEKGKVNTRVCLKCTDERLKVLTCDGHRIEKIEWTPDEERLLDPDYIQEGLEMMVYDKEGAEEINKQGEARLWKVRWCSVCVAVAEFECCSNLSSVSHHHSHTQDNTSGSLASGRENGCGLQLCLLCFDLHSKITRGITKDSQVKILDQLIKLREKDKWKTEDVEMRADVDFLRTDGELDARMKESIGLCYPTHAEMRISTGSPAAIVSNGEFGSKSGKLEKGMMAGRGAKMEVGLGITIDNTPTPNEIPKRPKTGLTLPDSFFAATRKPVNNPVLLSPSSPYIGHNQSPQPSYRHQSTNLNADNVPLRPISIRPTLPTMGSFGQGPIQDNTMTSSSLGTRDNYYSILPRPGDRQDGRARDRTPRRAQVVGAGDKNSNQLMGGSLSASSGFSWIGIDDGDGSGHDKDHGQGITQQGGISNSSVREKTEGAKAASCNRNSNGRTQGWMAAIPQPAVPKEIIEID